MTAKNCSVCTVDKPIVEKIATNMNFLHTLQKADKSPEIIGQLNAFLHRPLSYTMKEEIHRQAKIINFQRN